MLCISRAKQAWETIDLQNKKKKSSLYLYNGKYIIVLKLLGRYFKQTCFSILKNIFTLSLFRCIFVILRHTGCKALLQRVE